MDDEVEPQALSAADRAELVKRIEDELRDGALVAKLGKAANRLVRQMRKLGIPCRAKEPGREPGEELIHDAIVSTVLGERTWSGTYALEAHLRQAMRSIASTEIARRARKPALPMTSDLMTNDTNPDDEKRAFEMSRGAYQQTERPRRAIALVETVNLWFSAVRTRLPDDKQAIRVAQAWVDGHTVREDAITASGLSKPMYEAAKKRIKRVIESLPELSDGKADALEMTHGG